MGEFTIHSAFQPTGDQPEAIKALVEGIERGDRFQTLQGVTGSGKTFTMANIIEAVQRPTLVLAHNKTLASQLCSEFRQFFPENAVEYFVSFYDYYQPEAYVAATDTYIAKDSSINDEINKLRHSATAALQERRDVIVVASVSCIYGLGNPEEYRKMTVTLRPGMQLDRDELLRRLVALLYQRNDINFIRGTFRVRGDTVDIYPAGYDEDAIRVEFFGDEVDRVLEFNSLTGEIVSERTAVTIFAASHFASTEDHVDRAIVTIQEELADRLQVLRDENKLVEAQRLEQRTLYDLEMMQELGYCSGIENYSRHLDGRKPGERPYTLIDYFPDDFLLFVDESHQTLPQVNGMYNGDIARKQNLVNYGFRLPSALDNRPMKFDEFLAEIDQCVCFSATPGPFELEHSSQVVEQIIRPTGLLDPKVEVRPTQHQIDDLLGEIHKTIEGGERVLVTTLTKKMAEDLTHYLEELEIKVTYLHSDIGALERMEIIRDLRLGKFDVLVGINLLREGLDIPEVSLIAILDADKEGFLRSETSLVQTIGRAARNVDGHVIMYGDTITGSMKAAIDETNRRRSIQEAYNEQHGITPKSIVKKVPELISTKVAAEEVAAYNPDLAAMEDKESFSLQEIKELLLNMDIEMRQAAEALDFERAASIRDAIRDLQREYQLS